MQHIFVIWVLPSTIPSQSTSQLSTWGWGMGRRGGEGGGGGGDDDDDDDRLLYGVTLLLTSLEILKLLQGPHLRHRQLPKKCNGKLGWWKLSAISMILTQFNYNTAPDCSLWHQTTLHCRLAVSTVCHHIDRMIGSPTLLSTGNQEAPKCWKKYLGWIRSLPQSGPVSTPVQGALENLLGLRRNNWEIASGPKDISKAINLSQSNDSRWVRAWQSYLRTARF